MAQQLGPDRVHMTFTNRDGQQLHLTSAGHFQFGHGKDRQIVTSMEQLMTKDPRHTQITLTEGEKPICRACRETFPCEEIRARGFGEHVEGLVQAWLHKDGPVEAAKEQAEEDMAERGTQAVGSLDALAERLGKDVKVQLFNLLKAALGDTLTEADIRALTAKTNPSPESQVGQSEDELLEQDVTLPGQEMMKIPDGTTFEETERGVLLHMPDGRGGLRRKLLPGATLEAVDGGGVLLHVPGKTKQFFPDENILNTKEPAPLVAAGSAREVEQALDLKQKKPAGRKR